MRSKGFRDGKKTPHQIERSVGGICSVSESLKVKGTRTPGNEGCLSNRGIPRDDFRKDCCYSSGRIVFRS